MDRTIRVIEMIVKEIAMEKTKMFTFYVAPSIMKQFVTVGREQGLSMSSLLRVLVLREIRRAAKEEKAK